MAIALFKRRRFPPLSDRHAWTSATKYLIVDQAGQKYQAQIEQLDKEKVQVRIEEILEDDSELPVSVTIACGLSKGDKLEYIVQKGTETGMYHFIPLALKRDVVRWKSQRQEKGSNAFNESLKALPSRASAIRFQLSMIYIL